MQLYIGHKRMDFFLSLFLEFLVTYDMRSADREKNRVRAQEANKQKSTYYF